MARDQEERAPDEDDGEQHPGTTSVDQTEGGTGTSDRPLGASRTPTGVRPRDDPAHARTLRRRRRSRSSRPNAAGEATQEGQPEQVHGEFRNARVPARA